jgi:hypothetical protein
MLISYSIPGKSGTLVKIFTRAYIGKGP